MVRKGKKKGLGPWSRFGPDSIKSQEDLYMGSLDP